MSVVQRLLAVLALRGLQARAVPVEVLDDLRRETDARAGAPPIDPDLRERFLPGGFDYELARRDRGLRTLVVVASPSPQVRLTFQHGGRAVAARLGPSYVDRARVLADVKAMTAGLLGPAGHRSEPVVLPKKLLAARTGLGRYGRNNLLYVAGMGSFHRLTAFATDARCAADAAWEEPRLLDRCEGCTACLRTCPTGAVGGDRFLLHAERCLAFFNEKPFPFPDWIEPAWHECLVGCLDCQLLCPENKPHAARIEEAASFSEEETSALLEAAPDALPPALRGKLDALCLLPYLAVLPRNLRAVIDAARPPEAFA